ncbi:hypothetical protein A2118_00080 [Candidatus Kaiserbacteria bacterium GWA2_50_9]|uniref:dihydroneopterin aldolase n=1 Tax=Candidatus Kaiserbacteria bacterium GWA2_50_9 TaxID=1798474 RepID=A0A1F6BSF7_9BACT|nr:MAG: hypothetical protein A2118_00080 [Candidatus Kaiserbacteria bacterium GWA2_50_9]
MDYIHIDSLLFKGRHGVGSVERSVEQEFSVSVRLGVVVGSVGKSDRLEDTVDYKDIKNKIQAVIEGESRYLLERIAEDIAIKILENSRIQTVEITIKKSTVWDNGIPGVTITRTNP